MALGLVAVGPSRDIVLNSIDTCAPKPFNFGVPEKNVYREERL